MDLIWSDVFGVMAGTFMGVLSGIMVQIGVNAWSRRVELRGHLRNIQYELTYIGLKLDEYIQKLKQYEERVEADNLRPTSVYFDMGKILAPTFNSLHRKGGLYRYLRYEDLSGVITMAGKFSESYEVYFNKELRRVLDHGDRNKALGRIKGWLTDLRQDREALNVVIDRIKKHNTLK